MESGLSGPRAGSSPSVGSWTLLLFFLTGAGGEKGDQISLQESGVSGRKPLLPAVPF